MINPDEIPAIIGIPLAIILILTVLVIEIRATRSG